MRLIKNFGKFEEFLWGVELVFEFGISQRIALGIRP